MQDLGFQTSSLSDYHDSLNAKSGDVLIGRKGDKEVINRSGIWNSNISIDSPTGGYNLGSYTEDYHSWYVSPNLCDCVIVNAGLGGQTRVGVFTNRGTMVADNGSTVSSPTNYHWGANESVSVNGVIYKVGGTWVEGNPVSLTTYCGIFFHLRRPINGEIYNDGSLNDELDYHWAWDMEIMLTGSWTEEHPRCGLFCCTLDNTPLKRFGSHS